MAGVVHRDHRPEELVELLGQVGDVDTLARLEQLGVPRCLDDVGVLGDGVVAGARGQELVVGLGEEPDRILPAEGLERGVSHIHGFGPEPLDVGQIDLFELHGPIVERVVGLTGTGPLRSAAATGRVR